MPRPCPQQATSEQSPEARTDDGPELAKRAHWRTKSGDMVTHTRQTQEAETRTQGGHMADKWRTRFGGKAKTRRAHGGQMAGKVWRRGQSGLKVTRRKHGARGGKKEDTWRTKCGDVAKAEPGVSAELDSVSLITFSEVAEDW